MKIVIVGGGAFGITGAIELRKRGHQVLVLDCLQIPAQHASSTDVNKIIRADYGADVQYMHLALRCIERWHYYNTFLQQFAYDKMIEL